MKRVFFPAAILLLLLGSSENRQARAQATGDQQPKKRWFEELEAGAFVSSAYSYNLGKPDTRANKYRVFDFDDNSIKVDVMEIALRRDALRPNEAGFRFDFTAGSSVPRIARSSGLNSGDIDIHQVWIRYIAPLGDGLLIDVGKMVTHFGYEVIEGYDGFNDQYSRSFQFGYAIPFTHTGVRLTYAWSPRFTTMVTAVNGWDNTIDNNTGKSVGGQILMNPVDNMNLVLNFLAGPEQDKNDSHARSLVELVWSWNASEHLTVAFDALAGRERKLPADGTDVSWNGVAAYLVARFSSNFSCAVRGEIFSDTDGARTGTAQKLTGITLTPALRLTPNLLLRSDLRFDSSDTPVFLKGKDASKQQATVSLNMVFSM